MEEALKGCVHNLRIVNITLKRGVNFLKETNDKVNQFKKLVKHNQKYEIYTSREIENIRRRRTAVIIPQLPEMFNILEERIEEMRKLHRMVEQEVGLVVASHTLDPKESEVQMMELENKIELIQDRNKEMEMQHEDLIKQNEELQKEIKSYENRLLFYKNYTEKDKETLLEIIEEKCEQQYYQCEETRLIIQNEIRQLQNKLDKVLTKKESLNHLWNIINLGEQGYTEEDVSLLLNVFKDHQEFFDSVLVKENMNKPGLENLLREYIHELKRVEKEFTKDIELKLESQVDVEFKCLEKILELVMNPPQLGLAISHIIKCLYSTVGLELSLEKLEEKSTSKGWTRDIFLDALGILEKLKFIIIDVVYDMDTSFNTSDLNLVLDPSAKKVVQLLIFNK